MRKCSGPALAAGLFWLAASGAGAFEWSGRVGGELLSFTDTPLDGEQHRHYLSGVAEFEIYHLWDDGNQQFAMVPFLRVDQYDSERTHFDLRELTWLKATYNWELRVGIRKVFWGVSESQHLVDIINQTDLVENTDTEDKLGQPMVNFAWISDWGTLDLFLLTGFRERTFAGTEGRLRTHPKVDSDHAQFEHSGLARHLGGAVRWSQVLGDWDIGLSHFYGTSREPRLIPRLNGYGEPELIPYYDVINQTGLDVQATKGSWLWKLEFIHRSGQGETFNAFTAGFEYTWFDVAGSGVDVGLVSEYLYDDRRDDAPAAFQDDILAALRFTPNDVQNTNIIAGVIFDRQNNARFYNLEASRRLGSSFTIELEARFFSGASRQDAAYQLRQDDHIRMEVAFHF